MIVINEYIKHSNESESDNTQLDTGDDCNSFSEMYANGNNTVWKNICEQFIKLCKQLPCIKNSNENEPNYMKDWNFLSYWLNSKLRENKLNRTICPNDFYKGMEDHCSETLSRFVSSTNLIYNINEEDLSRMEVLYILHDNYNKLDTILKDSTSPQPESLFTPSSTCSYNYSIARYMCYGENNKFCQILEKFKREYEELFNTAKTKGDQYANNFKKLTDYDNSNIISTTLIGSAVGLIPLMGILYKFTPMGQMFRSNKGIVNNIISNNDEQMTNISLMEQENEPLRFKQGTYNMKYQPL
ncbi:PIR protein [Plasmodium vivax]|uniref:VIR protein n=1 Tax=Plasmodium vivax TaxID=5855 RepID=A0A565A5U4_PLAVI|nr:PIR protein [Plasmodium vivax]